MIQSGADVFKASRRKSRSIDFLTHQKPWLSVVVYLKNKRGFPLRNSQTYSLISINTADIMHFNQCRAQRAEPKGDWWGFPQWLCAGAWWVLMSVTLSNENARTQGHEAGCETDISPRYYWTLDSGHKLANTVASFHRCNRAVRTAPTAEIHNCIIKLESALTRGFWEFQKHGPMLTFTIKPDSVYGHKPDSSPIKWLTLRT